MAASMRQHVEKETSHPKKIEKVGPRGKKSLRFLALVENMEGLGILDRKNGGEAGGDLHPWQRGLVEIP